MTMVDRTPHCGRPGQSLGGYVCEMPGCGSRFSARSRPEFPVCPECQEAARKAAEAEKKRRQRIAKAQARTSA